MPRVHYCHYQYGLFCIEGQDGSGKETQVRELENRLVKEGYPVKTFSFPRYETSTGKLVKDYLSGRFGPPDKFDPWISSMFFACNRKAAAPEIYQLLEEGVIVLLNRYTPSNAAHQGGKIFDLKKREAFIHQIFDFEYGTLGLPSPCQTIILEVPPEQSIKNLQKRILEKGGELDGHEKEFEHIKAASETYKLIAEIYGTSCGLVPCFENGKMLPVEVIHENIWNIVSNYI